MILKIFKAIWFISVLAVLANLLYVYAGLPETVVVWEEGLNKVSVERDTFFYTAMALLAFVNVIVYLFKNSPQIHFRTWLHGLLTAINFFVIIGISYIGLYNSSENFDFARAGMIIYIAVTVLLVWTVAWPIFLVFRKISNKSTL
jgi:hypothetical protein